MSFFFVPSSSYLRIATKGSRSSWRSSRATFPIPRHLEDARLSSCKTPLFRERSDSTKHTAAVAASVALLATFVSTNNDHRHRVARCFPEEEEGLGEECVEYDSYNGVIVRAERVVEDVSSFSSMLESSLTRWKREGRRGIWISIPTTHAALIPICTTLGFDFQSASRGHVMLNRWLDPNIESRLPIGPTHQIGVGALLLHPTDQSKMLVVQEKSGPAAARKLWKMPTGLSDPGEDIGQAVVREVKEETGLDCTFHSIVCFRQAHHHGTQQQQQSDLFFVCLVTIQESATIRLIPQEEEIADIRWMNVTDYADQSVWEGSPVYREMNHAMIRAATTTRHRGDHPYDGEIAGFESKTLPVGFRPGTNTIYVHRL